MEPSPEGVFITRLAEGDGKWKQGNFFSSDDVILTVFAGSVLYRGPLWTNRPRASEQRSARHLSPAGGLPTTQPRNHVPGIPGVCVDWPSCRWSCVFAGSTLYCVLSSCRYMTQAGNE